MPPTYSTRIIDLLATLQEIRSRLKDHPAYQELTEEEELRVGGDTAEFSYLVRRIEEVL